MSDPKEERAAICGELRLAFSNAFGAMLLLTDEELEEAIKARWEVPTTTPSTALGAIAAANDVKQALIVIGARS